MRAAGALPLALLAGCAPALGSAPGTAHGVVSLDYCADQMVLGLVPRARILAVSPEAASDTAFSAPHARGIARVRPALEEIIRLRPRYAVRLYGGSPGIDRQLAALGVEVIQLTPADRLDAIPAELARVGNVLGAQARANALTAAFRRNVTAARATPASPNAPTLLYMTPGDVTTGADGMVGDIISTAGYRSIRDAPGWGSLPVEAMVRRPPDAILRAFFETVRYRQDRWSSSGHPRMTAIVAKTPTLTLPGSALACGNWLAGDAVRQLAALRARSGAPS
jgi:iron complex transport system substrate-binding protein